MGVGSGGVQQWVIGLAAALSGLDDETEEYLFLVNEGQGEWLRPYLKGRSSLVVQPAMPGATSSTAGASSAPMRRGIETTSARARRFARSVWRSMARSAGWRLPSPFDRTMRTVRADIVHFTRPSASSTALPNIYQPWDLQHVHLPEFFDPEVLRDRDATYRRFCAQASLIVVATRWVKDDLVASYGLAPERIAVVNPPPVTEAYPVPTADEERAIAARLDLPDRYAFYPAQTWGHKNHERLLDALGQLRRRGIDVPLICSGHRNQRYARLVELAHELGIDGQVRFLGFLSPAEIQLVYRRATCLIFPTLYEGWGLPIVEAFWSGLPVACSNVTSLPALVGDAALVFDPLDPAAIASAIERLWTDANLRTELAERGRARFRQFDWRTTALTLRAHYRRLGGRRLDGSEIKLLAAEPLV